MPFTIDTGYTLAEVLKSYDPEGKLHHVIDVFSDKRPLLEEAYWTEANGDTYHEMERLTSKPTGAFTSINEGYANEGVTVAPFREQLALIGSRCDLDKRLADIQRDPGAWRAERSRLHVKGMIENWHNKFWRGNSATDSKEVDGILTRYNTLAQTGSVTNLSGSANLYPVVIMGWGKEKVQLLYPKGGKKTFWEDDRGEVELLDRNSLPFPGYRSYFNFNYGIGVGDDRYVQRMVNVDVTAIQGSDTFENKLSEAISMMPDLDKVAIYCGRQVMTAIKQRLNSKGNINFTLDTVWGRKMPTFEELPIIRDDSLSVTESVVS